MPLSHGHYKKSIQPWVSVTYSKNNHTIRLSYAQIQNIVRMIIFDKGFLKELKKALKNF